MCSDEPRFSLLSAGFPQPTAEFLLNSALPVNLSKSLANPTGSLQLGPCIFNDLMLACGVLLPLPDEVARNGAH